ncbi:UMP kinase, partial [Streptomyces sp. NPDC058953]
MNKGADATQAAGDNSDHDGNHDVTKAGAGRFMLKLSGEAFSGGGGIG